MFHGRPCAGGSAGVERLGLRAGVSLLLNTTAGGEKQGGGGWAFSEKKSWLHASTLKLAPQLLLCWIQWSYLSSQALSTLNSTHPNPPHANMATQLSLALRSARLGAVRPAIAASRRRTFRAAPLRALGVSRRLCHQPCRLQAAQPPHQTTARRRRAGCRLRAGLPILPLPLSLDPAGRVAR